MCNFNPIELAWRKVKNYIRNYNGHGSLNFTKLIEISGQAIMPVTESDWVGYIWGVEDSDWIVSQTLLSHQVSDDDSSDSGSERSFDTVRERKRMG